MNTFIKSVSIALLATALVAGISSAQDFIDPGYSGAVQAAQWEYFTYANTNAGVGNPPQLSEGSPNTDFNQFNPSLLTSGGNIISPWSPLSSEVTASSSTNLGGITFQVVTFGDEDWFTNNMGMVRLVLDNGAEFAPTTTTNFHKEYEDNVPYSGWRMGYAFEWAFERTTVTNYSLVFDTPLHTSLDRLRLDTQGVPFNPELSLGFATEGFAVIQFVSEDGVDYQLHTTSSLTNAMAAAGSVISGDGSMLSITNETSGATGFFSVEAWFGELE